MDEIKKANIIRLVDGLDLDKNRRQILYKLIEAVVEGGGGEQEGFIVSQPSDDDVLHRRLLKADNTWGDAFIPEATANVRGGVKRISVQNKLSTTATLADVIETFNYLITNMQNAGMIA